MPGQEALGIYQSLGLKDKERSSDFVCLEAFKSLFFHVSIAREAL